MGESVKLKIESDLDSLTLITPLVVQQTLSQFELDIAEGMPLSLEDIVVSPPIGTPLIPIEFEYSNGAAPVPPSPPSTVIKSGADSTPRFRISSHRSSIQSGEPVLTKNIGI